MTSLSRVGSVTLLNDTLRDVTNVQEQLGQLQEQISSGVKAKTFQQLNGQVEQYTLMENKLRRTEQFMASNEIAISRLETTDQAMGQLVDIADGMENLIVLARNTTSQGTLQFKQQMQDYLVAMANALNINFDGHYLFGGAETMRPPVPDTATPPAVNGVPDNGYYEGANTNLSIRADENISYTFPVRADDVAFQKMYAAAHQAMKAWETGDDTNMKAALELMQAGQTDLNAARARVNTTTLNITDANDRLKQLNLYWKGVTEKIGKTDVVAATTQISSYEAVLQATFQVYARLSQLRLSDFLR